MKKIFALPLVALLFAACSEPTANATADIDLAYAKKTPPAPAGCTTCPVDMTYNFSDGATISGGGTSIDTELQPGIVGIEDAPAVVTAPSGEKFLGRFENVRTQIILTVPAGNPKYSLEFDLYTIGSWDGKGRQAQQGIFQANVFSIGARCGGPSATVTQLLETTFSNQLTVQQDYPLDISFGGGNKAATGSYDTDALNYRSDPVASNTPEFRSFGDVSYTLKFGGDNPCGTAATTFVFNTSNPTQQSLRDESWGIDNVKIKAGT